MVTKIETVLFRTRNGEEFKLEHDAEKCEARETLAKLLYDSTRLDQAESEEVAGGLLETPERRAILEEIIDQYKGAVDMQERRIRL